MFLSKKNIQKAVKVDGVIRLLFVMAGLYYYLCFYGLVVSKRFTNKIRAAFSDNDGSYLLIAFAITEVDFIYFFMHFSTCLLYANVTLEIKPCVTVYFTIVCYFPKTQPNYKDCDLFL